MRHWTIIFTIVALGACGTHDADSNNLNLADGTIHAPLLPARVPLAVSKRTELVGLTASRWRQGEVAVWSAEEVVIHSATHRSRRLPLPASSGRVVGGTFDFRGQLHLLFQMEQGGTLVSWGPGPQPAVRALSFVKDTTLFTSTRSHLVWVGQSERAFEAPPMRVFRDGRWTGVKVPAGGNAGLELFVGLDGTLQLMTGSEARCGGGGQHRDLGRIGRKTWQDAPWPLDTPYGWLLGPRGWAYARVLSGDDDCGHQRAGAWICAVHGNKAQPVRFDTARRAQPSARLRRALKDWWPDGGPRADNGRVRLITVDDLVLELSGSRGRALSAPRNLSSLAVDAGGTIYALAGARLLRWSGAWHPVRIR